MWNAQRGGTAVKEKNKENPLVVRHRQRKQVRRMLIASFRLAGADRLIVGYLVFYFVAAIPIWLLEPDITNYGDSLWFCFASATSIGYGDFIAVTPIGRIIAVVLTFYSMAVLAVSTAVFTSFFSDLARFRADNSARRFLDDLQHLSELSKDELRELSERVRKFQQRK